MTTVTAPSGVELVVDMLTRLDKAGAVPSGRLRWHSLWAKLTVPRKRTAYKGRAK
jgi:hypothetical protein